MNGKIYIIKNYINNKAYIGQTQLSLKERFNTHKKLAKSKKSKKQYIHKAMFKHGVQNFYIKILQTNISTIEELNEWEIFYIEYFNTFHKGYNLNSGGSGNPRRKKLYKKEDINNIIYLYESKKVSILKISKIYKVSTKLIKNILIVNNVFLKRKQTNQGIDIIPIETLIMLYEKCKNYRKVARDLNINHSNVIRRIKNYYNK